jgi:hypothetical protein
VIRTSPVDGGDAASLGGAGVVEGGQQPRRVGGQQVSGVGEQLIDPACGGRVVGQVRAHIRALLETISGSSDTETGSTR